MECRWFVTPTAIEQYMKLCGEDPADRPAFHRAAARLQMLCRHAEYKRSYAGGRFESWRVKTEIGGKARRLNLSISLDHRGEGYADQLVSVQDNDRR